MHESGVVTRNQKETFTSGCDIENVETCSVNNPSVSGIECVDKIAIESCGVKLSKTHVGVVSGKYSPVRSEEEISNYFVNQVLSETIASVIDGIEKNVVCGLGSPSESSEKFDKGPFF